MTENPIPVIRTPLSSSNGDAIRAAPSIKNETPSLATIGVAEIFKPQGALPLLVEALGLAPGAPCCFAGYGFAGKTLCLQDMALAVASGGLIWNEFRAKEGRVLHIDYEQGRRLSSTRYQRLARARGLTPDDLGDRLELAVLPTLFLDKTGAEEAYVRAADGFTLVIVDSLRAAAPGADENSSEIRKHIDALARVSERTGAAVIFVHHARKPAPDAAEGVRYKIRGSAAIYDACASVFVLEGSKGAPTVVHHEKDREQGILLDDFGLRIEDVAIDGVPKAGLRVSHVAHEDIDASANADAPQVVEAAGRAVLHIAETGAHLGPKGQLANRMGGKRQTALAGINAAIADGRLVIKNGPSGTLITLGPQP